VGKTGGDEMSKFSNTGIPTVGELTGTAPDLKSEGKRCSYCTRAWSKGFDACPQCGLKVPADYWDSLED
jgi:predicted amidophosphoribosyltransferase